MKQSAFYRSRRGVISTHYVIDADYFHAVIDFADELAGRSFGEQRKK